MMTARHLKFYTADKKRMTAEAISILDWRDVSMDIILSKSSIVVNAGNWGAVATPQCTLVRPQDSREFSGGEGEISTGGNAYTHYVE